MSFLSTARLCDRSSAAGLLLQRIGRTVVICASEPLQDCESSAARCVGEVLRGANPAGATLANGGAAERACVRATGQPSRRAQLDLAPQPAPSFLHLNLLLKRPALDVQVPPPPLLACAGADAPAFPGPRGRARAAAGDGPTIASSLVGCVQPPPPPPRSFAFARPLPKRLGWERELLLRPRADPRFCPIALALARPLPDPPSRLVQLSRARLPSRRASATTQRSPTASRRRPRSCTSTDRYVPASSLGFPLR